MVSALKRINIKKMASWAGSLLMLVSLGFIGRRIFLTSDDMDWAVFSNPVILGALFSVAILEGVGILATAINYRAMVANVSGVKVKYPLALVVYTVSNLYKYIPGGVMYVLGRNKMAIDTDGLSHAKVGIATFLEGATIAIAAIVVTLAFSFNHTMYYLRHEVDFALWLLILIASILLVLVCVVICFRKKLHKLWLKIKEDTKDLRPMVMARRLLFALVLMVLFAFTFLATLMLLGQEVTFRLGITIMGLYMLSWVVGFLTPGAPSGLGIREMVMVMFMGDALNATILVSAMVMHRLLTMTGDISAYGMALAFARWVKTRENGTKAKTMNGEMS